MKFFITVSTFILITQNVVQTSPVCEFKNTLSVNEIEIKSTNDYLEVHKKFIENVVSNNHIPDRTITHNGYKYFANVDGLFVQQESESSATKIDGFDQFTNIFLDKNFNQIYVGTQHGLFALKCGGTKTKKIGVTDNIMVDFGVVDNIGNIYFGTDGDNSMLREELYILRKDDNSVTKIKGIEKSLGSYTIENIRNPNKLAVDSKNNVYVGAFTSYIYLIKSGETTAIKLKDLRNSGGVTSIIVDSKDNVYFRTNNALFVLKSNDIKLVKITESIDDFNYFLSIDANDNVYFQVVDKTYALKSVDVKTTEINTISNSKGFIQTNFTNLRNVNVKNNILYLTTMHNDKELICGIMQNETSLTEIHRTDNEIISLAIDNYNNLYFITFSSTSQKYVPFVLRKNANIPIEIRGVTGHLSYVFSDNKNNVYFGSGNGLHKLEEDEVTPYKLRATESQISSFVVDKSDNVYFGTDYDGAFVLKSGETEATKIDGINKKFGSYVETFGDKKYDVIYFKTGGALYKLNGGDTLVSKVVEAFSPEFYFSDCLNNTYYVSENSSIFSIISNETVAKHVFDIDGQVLRMNSDSANNIYFVTDNNQLQVLRNGKNISEKLTHKKKVTSLNIDREDNVYFTADDDVFVLRSGESESIKIKNIHNKLEYFVTNDDDVYFITSKNDHEKGLFLLRNKLRFETIFKNRHLGEIDNNDDDTILNMLNYVNFKDNYLLSEIKNKILQKTSTSATILAINGKYSGRFMVTYTIENKASEYGRNFDFLGLLKKAIFFYYTNINLYNVKKTNEIQDIFVFTDNLRFSFVEVTRKSELSSSVEFKNVCFNKKRVPNTSPLPQTIKIPECNYETKEIILFHITTGLNKTNKVNEEESVASPLNEEDEIALTNFLNINDVMKNVDPKVTLSNSFDLSNLVKHSHEMSLRNITEDEQEIIIPPKQRILVNYSVRSLVLETELNLKQKIKGTLVATIVDTSSEQTLQITVKEAMQILKKYGLLPHDISINEDNSITFNGKAKMTIKRESEPKIIRNFVDI